MAPDQLVYIIERLVIIMRTKVEIKHINKRGG